jgi:Bestrophin, RFP-TM, chloride channel
MTSVSVPTPRTAPPTPKLKTRIAAMIGMRQPISLQDDVDVVPEAAFTGSPVDIVPPPILHSQNDDISDVANKRRDEEDQVPFLTQTVPTLEYPIKRATAKKKSDDKLHLLDTSNAASMNEQGSSTAASSIKSVSFHSDEDLPEERDADMCLPMEILFRISLFLNQAKAAGRIESTFVVSCTSSIDTLTNSLTAFERIRHTPIPKAYDIHL